MSDTLQQKFADPHRSVCFVGTTPPKASTEDERMQEIAARLLARLDPLEYDGLIVYDIQDESSRIHTPRPFPYMETRDPRDYSRLLGEQSGKPIITYKSVAQREPADFARWLEQSWHDYGVRHLVLVGSPSSEGEIKLTLNAAYAVLQQQPHPFHLGGVTIAERHAAKGNEHERLLSKMAHGCEFFVSQAVYNARATINLLTSYAARCREQGLTPRRIILTFTPCGSAKTLEFMQWLGISIPEATRHRILGAEQPLVESIRICQSNLEQILDACLPLGLPLGLNIESLTNRKAEIDASIQLYQRLKATLDRRLAERQPAQG
jgi:5,10-methylenetetrahydrofolate reductase